MKAIILPLLLSLVLFSANANTTSPSINGNDNTPKKVFSYDKEKDVVTFSDTDTELLLEIYFYDDKNKPLAVIRNINYDTDFDISCWEKVHHVVILTDKKVHIEYVH